MNNNFNNVQYDPMTGQPINQQPQQQPVQNQTTTNMYSQPMQPTSTVNTYQQPTESQQPKKKINPKLLIIIVIAIIIVIVGIIFIPKLFGNNEKDNVSKSLTDSTSFWVRNSENLYAMFDIDGKQLTGFDYTSVNSEFINGTANVENKNNEYGLISSSGKMIIEFGKYDYISQQYAVYEMTDKEYNKYLYDSSGKFIRQLEKDEDIRSYIGEYTYALIESDTEYKVIDYNGKEITSFAVSKDDSDISSPKGNSKKNYVSIFYNNINYIIDISKGKLLLTIPDSRIFCISDINDENPDEFILNTCESSYDKEGSKVVRNGKVAYSKESEYGSMKFNGSTVVYQSGDTYLLDENGNEKTKANSYIIYKDYNNYVKQADGILNGAELYVNGALKEKLNCDNIQGGYARHGVYLLDHCSGYGKGNKIYLNYDGTRINDKSYERAYEFDENGYASVSEDAKNFYVINLKGEKVSDYYSNNSSAEKIYNVNGTEDLYYGTNEDGTTTIFKINGKKLVTGQNIQTQLSNNVIYAIIENDGKYTIRDLKKEKDIVTVDSKPNTYPNYFTTSVNSKTQYYSYTTGKLFYEG